MIKDLPAGPNLISGRTIGHTHIPLRNGYAWIVPTPLAMSHLRIHFVDNLDLDAAIPRVGANLHRIHRFLQRHRVSDKLLQIEDLATKALNASRPRVAVAVDEA